MNPTKALQLWCKQQCEGYRDVSITNMTTSFRDGLAFCAILHKHRPDLIDFNSLSKENVYENNHLAFHVAEEKLGIPALLDAEDMVKLRVPDRLSILTYVSQYYNYFHGRSPIGGMAAIKRPPPDAIEEPAGKKITSHIPTNPQTTPTPQPAPRSSPSVLKRNYVTENPPVRATVREPDNSSSISSSCAICGKHVHLVQRHLADGKLYHRNCFRCKQCSRTLQPGNYKIGDYPGTLICTSHHPVTPASPVTNNTTPSGPHKHTVSALSDNRRSPAFISSAGQELTNKTPAGRLGPSGTNQTPPETTNRTAVGFVSNTRNGPSSQSTPVPDFKVSHNFPKTENSPSGTTTAVHPQINRPAEGFYSAHKSSPSSVVSEQSNKAVPSYLSSSRGNQSAAGSVAHEQTDKPTVTYSQASKGKTDSTNATQRETKKEPLQNSHLTKTSSSTSNPITVPSISTGKWTSPVIKQEPKEESPKPFLSSAAAKNKEARERFFQTSQVVPEPANNKSPAVQESPLSSNGPGRAVTISPTPGNVESNSDRDKARNLILKALPRSTTPALSAGADISTGVYIPHRNFDEKHNISSPSEVPQRPVPKERTIKSLVPKTVSSVEPPASTPTYTVSKTANTPSTGSISKPTQPSLSSPGAGQKVEAVQPKAVTPSSKESKSEAPEDWRSLLKSTKTQTPKSVLLPKETQKETPPFKEKDTSAPKTPSAPKTQTTSAPKTPTTPKTQTTQKTTTTITTVTVTIGPNASGKENKPTQPSTPSITQNQERSASSTPTPPKKKLLPVNLDLISDWPKPEQKWQDGVGEGDAPKYHTHWTRENNVPSKNDPKKAETRHYNGENKPLRPPFPNSTNNDMISTNKHRPEYIPEEEIQRQLQIIEQELDSLELRGVDLEKQLRSCDGDDSEDSLMVDWFKLIHEKQLLLRQESELNYISKQQALENQQSSVETELRNLMKKPEHLKSQRDKDREKELLDKYLLIVNDRSEIIECLDEDRIREKEEDEMMEAMIQRHTESHHKDASPQPNSKRRSRFSFSGLFKPKDKTQT
ncbi:MICAL-like protein 2 [Rhinophrynus dorsalis]